MQFRFALRLFAIALTFLVIGLAQPASIYATSAAPTDEERTKSAQYSPNELCISGIAGLNIANELAKTNAKQAKEKYEYAAKMFWLAAERGDALAQQNLGNLYHDGLGVPQSYEQAFMWFRKAAVQGLYPAQSQIGLMYEYGLGIRQDFAEAAKWYQAAALQHYPPAQAKLGAFYAQGMGVPKNLLLAHMWLNLGAAAGDRRAFDDRNRVAKLLTPEQLTEAQAMARDWIKQHPSKCMIEGTCLPLEFK